MQPTILVTGATGTVGQEVIKALLQKNAVIKAAMRDVSKARDLPWLKQVEVVTLDFNQPETLKKALTNINKLFLLTPPGSFQEPEVAALVLEYGKKQGLQQIVRLSGIGAAQHNLFGNHHAADTLLLNAGIAYTALQPNTFMQNFYNYLTSIKQKHKIFEPAGSGKTSFIDVRDVAAVATTVLTEPGHANKIYELTGNEALDYYQVAILFSEILKVKITYEPLTDKEYIADKEAAGMPAAFAERFIQFFQRVQKGEYAVISPAVENILGRPPISLKQFITDYRERFL